MMESTEIPSRMMKSRLMTITVKPSRNDVQNRQGHKGTGQKRLVGDRIQIGPEHGLLVQDPGQKSVEGIGKAGNDKHDQRLEERALDEQDDDDRYRMIRSSVMRFGIFILQFSSASDLVRPLHLAQAIDPSSNNAGFRNRWRPDRPAAFPTPGSPPPESPAHKPAMISIPAVCAKTRSCGGSPDTEHAKGSPPFSH